MARKSVNVTSRKSVIDNEPSLRSLCIYAITAAQPSVFRAFRSFRDGTSEEDYSWLRDAQPAAAWRLIRRSALSRTDRGRLSVFSLINLEINSRSPARHTGNPI